MSQEFTPNFTQYPNEILDCWMPHLTGNQFKILSSFVRSIYGYHKKSDKISIRQLSQKTGITTAKVFGDVKNLIKIGCINIVKRGDKRNPHTYEIINITEVLPERKHKARKQGVTVEETGCYPEGNSGVISEVTEVLPRGEQQNKEINLKEKCEKKASEPSPAIITTSTRQLNATTLADPFYKPPYIKESIYQYLHAKGIQVTPGADEAAITKHRDLNFNEFMYKINRIVKLDYVKKNWRTWENWIDKTQLPLFQKAELQSGTISWALSNYSTDIDPLYNVIESFIRRQEEERRHKEAERERKEAEREENYRKLREEKAIKPEPLDEDEFRPRKSIIEQVQEKKKIREQGGIDHGTSTEIRPTLTEQEIARMTALLCNPSRTKNEDAELREITQKRRTNGS